MTSVTQEAGNRYTAHHHQRESPALGSARQNRYTDPLHTASAERRHCAATRWLRDGVRIEVVSALLGHSSVTMTQSVYGKSRELRQTGEKSQVARSARCLAGFRGFALGSLDQAVC